MKVVIIVLVVIAIAFVAVAIGGGSRTDIDSGKPPPRDQDALSDSGWTPPDSATLLGRLFAPFAPGLDLPNPHIAVAPGGSESRFIPASTSRFKALRTRVLRVKIASPGGGLLIEYGCVDMEGRTCPQRVCICSPGAAFTPQQILACKPDSWRRKRLDGVACTNEDAETNLVIYPEPGQVTFTGIGMSTVSADLQ